MILVTVPRELVLLDDLRPEYGSYDRPALGAFSGRTWHQASSHERTREQGIVRIVADITEDEVDNIDGARFHAVIADEKQTREWVDYAQTSHPKYAEYKQAHHDAGAAIKADAAAKRDRVRPSDRDVIWTPESKQPAIAFGPADLSPSTLALVAERERLNAIVAPWHATPVAEKHDAIRSAVRSLDIADSAAIVIRDIADKLPALLAMIALGLWGPAWASLAATVISSDSFAGVGAFGELNGRTMNAAYGGSGNTWHNRDGNGYWFASVAGGNVRKAVDEGAGGNNLLDSTMSNVADGDVDYVHISDAPSQQGPVIRGAVPSGNDRQGYVCIFNGGAAWRIFVAYNGPGYTQIGSDSSSSTTSGNLINVSASGTTIGATVNGASSVSGTDSSYSTGKFGVFALSTGGVGDDYVGRQASGGGTVVPLFDGEMLVGGFLRMSGGL